ncbi:MULTISPECIES: hypothetical protein [Enterococcus]|uniref:hypothetical protein n=1 Tax=Enterococcus TaxID=1350 RepID=UPI001F2B78AE|nr:MULTISPECIES: hypothetical protein [Enterococcus]MCO8259191.1 hypothetical protein [Enterococcus faecalis]MCP8907246.1 hypothetical protein [Enterococcus faecalis]MCP8910249.1 hypothetical protein [Enterococcus faecalis]MCP8913340.1 hypothetical protein [Enterococcus faecalis]MCP8936115.1 hypothetical protein [Enterococcus faecalis]
MRRLSNTTMANETLKKEAWYRMMLTDLSSSVIDEFMETGKCHYTSNYFQGENILVTEEIESIIKTAEKRYGFLVYYVTENKTADGQRFLSLFYVAPETNDWLYCHRDLESYRQYVYVVNTTNPAFSEFGMIQFDPILGSLLRTS